VIATPAVGGITLRWTAGFAATSYTIRRVIAGHASTIVASGITATTFTVRLDTSGADASYVVTAVNAAGESLTSTPMHVPWGAAVSRTTAITRPT
jgi:fibronectin type 3 domain-containing protein